MSGKRPVRAATPPKRTPVRAPSGCQIGDLFKLLGESYVLDMLYVFLSDLKPRRFLELQKELNVSPNTLTSRLRALTEAGLLTRTAYNEIPPRVEYAATPKTVEFEPMFRDLAAWAQRNTLEPATAPPSA